MYRKICFNCRGTGVNWTSRKLSNFLKSIKNQKQRVQEYDNLRNTRNQAHCTLCHGRGVLKYP